MCRLTAYIGAPICAADLVTRPDRSIVQQSFSARERVTERGYLNGDGHGLGWYPMRLPDTVDVEIDQSKPAVYTSEGPAWNSLNLTQISNAVVSHLLFAHVRAATAGTGVSLQCCHPFVYGRYMFMHNGNVGQYARVRRELMTTLSPELFDFAADRGGSDSAFCFALFLNTLEEYQTALPPNVLRQKLQEVIELLTATAIKLGIRDMSMLNFVLTDGATLVATRYLYDPDQTQPSAASLYFAAGSSFFQQGAEGTYRMTHSERRKKLVIVTSEPLTDDATDWVPVPHNHCLLITEDIHTLLLPIIVDSCTKQQIPSILAGRFDADFSSSLTRSMSTHSTNTPHAAHGTSTHDAAKRPQPLHRRQSAIRLEHVHALRDNTEAILTLAVHGEYLFTGGEDGIITAWALPLYSKAFELSGHASTIFSTVTFHRKALDMHFLISTSSNGTICIWKTEPPFECVLRLCFRGTGDALCVTAVEAGLVLGFSDTSVRLVDVWGEVQHRIEANLFDLELISCGVAMPTFEANQQPQSMVMVSTICPSKECNLSARHFGEVHALVHMPGYIISASGDGSINVWNEHPMTFKEKLLGHSGSVMALSSWDCTLFSGARDGTVKAWDLETMCVVDTKLCSSEHEVLSLATGNANLFCGLSSGSVLVLACDTLTKVAFVENASGPAIALLVDPDENQLFVTLEQTVQIFNLSDLNKTTASRLGQRSRTTSASEGSDDLLAHLGTLVAIPSVSGSPRHKLDCFDAAKTLASILGDMCCEDSDLLSMEGHNPLVVARTRHKKNCPHILVYGHYDVMPADEEGWNTNPFQVEGINGYLYGRGVTDDKGPVLAIAAAVRDLLMSNSLNVNVHFLIEGEAENKSSGFQDLVAHILDADMLRAQWLPAVDLIFMSNSYWHDDEHPCINYSTRGLLKIELGVCGAKSNAHSGVDGGPMFQPTVDLSRLLATLCDSSGRVTIPGFYEGVAAITPEELAANAQVGFDPEEYKKLLGVDRLTSDDPLKVLAARWREPCLVVSSLATSNTDKSFSILPNQATAKISVRYVPDQAPSEVVAAIQAHLDHEFRKLGSPNQLSVEVTQSSPWWLGDIRGHFYEAMSASIEAVWGVPPLLVREGGTINTTTFLVQRLDAPALHLPMGQASDGAHLQNERIRLINLMNGKVRCLVIYAAHAPGQASVVDLLFSM